MKRGNVYRIYPDDEQKTLIKKHISCSRFIYNRFLRIKKTLFYDKFRINISLLELDKYLPMLKEIYPMLKEIYPWLKEVNSQSLQEARKNLQDAYSRFFKGQNGFPQWKTKKDTNKSFQIPQRYRLNLTTSQVYLEFPVLGKKFIYLTLYCIYLQYAFHGYYPYISNLWSLVR